MPDVTETVDVHVPIRTAYDQWTQFESFPEFMDGVESVRQLDERRTHWVTEVGGVRREFDAEITEQHPDERIAWKSIGGDARHAGVVTFHRLGDRDTRVTVQLAWEPVGLVEKAGAFLGVDDRQVKADARRFKDFIEQRGTETGQWRGDVPAPAPVHAPARTPASAATPTSAPTSTPAPASAPTPALATATGAPAGATRQTSTGADSSTQATVENGSRGRDAVDVLLAQHQQIRQALTRVETADAADKREAFAGLVALLRLHESGEQQVVHPVTRTDTPDGDMVVGERVAEEQQADQTIARLTEMGTGHPGFDEAFAKFHQAVLTHAEHEESQEFPRLRRDVPAEKLHALGTELLESQNAQL